ncbi:cell division protein FtsZ [Flavobacteriaceae bacterium]|jgi:cell division protein FtsZ|nr:cell division protein FtsZ [Flavobacteriaceae bacterium]MDC0957106.1 cell division protein FtsZ [Flavobacteriaceae bacterium]
MNSNKDFGITFDLPKNQSNVIKVIGVGGGGSNAINHMFQQGIKGVDFVICNTDSQALQNSGVPNKIQLGVNLTEGLGAGANPEIGEQAAHESMEEIRTMLDTNTKMVFITAGMGGGTGTGAAPVIAKIAKEMDILTVGIVTMPFQFEGKIRIAQAQKGIETLRTHVDSLVVINNNKLREVYGNLGFKAGFSKADEVLSTASRGIAEVITHHYTQNIDLRDAKTVLSNSGTAIMGSSTASGTNRANEAIMKALDSPLLNDNKISGAKNVLLLIVSGSQEITIDEIGEINDHIQTEAGFGANIIMGVGEDESLQESISVTIIATGFNVDQQDEISNTEVKKVVHSLEDDQNQQDLHLDRDPAIIRPDIILETQDHKIVHSLITEEDIVPEVELIDTTDVIRNISVVYDEVLANVEEEEFIIHEVASAESEVEIPSSSSQEDEQTMLTFDLPLTSLDTQSQTLNTKDEDNAKIFNLDDDDDIKEIPVKDYIELIAVTEANEEGETRYALDDYIMLESSMNSSENEQGQEQVVLTEVEEDIVFEKKIIEEIETKEFVEDLDPMNSPISEILKERADERRQKMKEFNYKFNNAKIDDIEKEPAYKRQGVNLDAAQHSSETNASRLSLGTDDNDDIQLRSNNSFLHDNVD